jgi:hypothetical protein
MKTRRLPGEIDIARGGLIFERFAIWPSAGSQGTRPLGSDSGPNGSGGPPWSIAAQRQVHRSGNPPAVDPYDQGVPVVLMARVRGPSP